MCFFSGLTQWRPEFLDFILFEKIGQRKVDFVWPIHSGSEFFGGADLIDLCSLSNRHLDVLLFTIALAFTWVCLFLRVPDSVVLKRNTKRKPHLFFGGEVWTP